MDCRVPGWPWLFKVPTENHGHVDATFSPKIWGKTFRLGMAKEMRRINIFLGGGFDFLSQKSMQISDCLMVVLNIYFCLFACHPGFLRDMMKN